MKLIIKGIELIYGDRSRHSFLGRQIRGLLLFSLASVASFGAVALSMFGRPLEQWIAAESGNFSLLRNFLIVTLPACAMILAMSVLALIYRVARPGTTTWNSVCLERPPQPFCGGASICCLEFTFGRPSMGLSTVAWPRRSA